MKIETLIWQQWLLNGGYRYRVTDVRPEKNNQLAFENNRLMQDPLPSLDNRNASNLKPEISQWLIDTLPYSAWKEERTYRNGSIIAFPGIFFSSKKHIMMFKLAFG